MYKIDSLCVIHWYSHFVADQIENIQLSHFKRKPVTIKAVFSVENYDPPITLGVGKHAY